MVHLSVGYKLLELCDNITDKNAFLLGTLSPDAIMFRSGCERSDKSTTHFCTGDEGWGFYTNYDEWEHNFFENIEKFKGTVDRDFLFGYASHIFADIENSRRFWTPIRLSGDETVKSAWFNDCDEMDSILLNSIHNINELWPALEAANNDKRCLPGLFTADDNAALINKMKTEMYHNRYPNPEYAPSIFTASAASQFIDDIAAKSTEYIKAQNKR